MNIADDLVRAFNDGYEKGKSDAEAYLLHCGDTDEPKTNADKLRAMSDEELAEKIGGSIDCEVCKTMHHSESGECPSRPHQSCVDFWLGWLRQEVGT
jgi:hypothetical protein